MLFGWWRSVILSSWLRQRYSTSISTALACPGSTTNVACSRPPIFPCLIEPPEPLIRPILNPVNPLLEEAVELLLFGGGPFGVVNVVSAMLWVSVAMEFLGKGLLLWILIVPSSTTDDSTVTLLPSGNLCVSQP